MDEQELTRQALLGNTDAFGQLVNRFYGRVFAHSLNRLGNRTSAEEVTQETFLKAYIGIRRLQETHSLGPWLFTICNNEIASLCKRQSRYSQAIQRVGKEKPFAAVSPVTKDHKQLLQALDRLPPGQHEILTLKYFAGLSMKEIAVLLGIPDKTVKSRLYEARQALSGLLANPDAVAFPTSTQQRNRRKMIMDMIQLMDVGAQVISRMSLTGQIALYRCAQSNQHFAETVLTELSQIPKGKELVQLCNGSLAVPELLPILTCCDRFVVGRLVDGLNTDGGADGDALMREVTKYLGMGYLSHFMFVTLRVPSIDESIEWYQRVLGWKGSSFVFDEQGVATFGCVYQGHPQRDITSTFSCEINLCRGEAPIGDSGFTAQFVIADIDQLYQRIQAQGWKQVSPIEVGNWGCPVRTLSVTDLNGYHLVFGEGIAEE